MSHLIDAFMQSLDGAIYHAPISEELLSNESLTLANAIAIAVIKSYENNDLAMAEIILGAIVPRIEANFERFATYHVEDRWQFFALQTLAQLAEIFVSSIYQDVSEITDIHEITDELHKLARKHLPLLTNFDWAYRICSQKTANNTFNKTASVGIHAFYMDTEQMQDLQRMHYLLSNFQITEDNHFETFKAYYAENSTLHTLLFLAHPSLALDSIPWEPPAQHEYLIPVLVALSRIGTSQLQFPDFSETVDTDEAPLEDWVHLALQRPDITKITNSQHVEDLNKIAECTTVDELKRLNRELRARSLGPSSRAIERHIEQMNWEVSTRRALINRLNDFCAHNLESSKLNVAIYPAIFEAFKPEPRQRPGAAGNPGAVIDDTKIPQLIASTQDHSAINRWLAAFLQTELNDEFFMQRAIQHIGAHMPASTQSTIIRELKDYPSILAHMFNQPFGSIDFPPQLRAEQIRLVVKALDEHVPLWNGYSVPRDNMTWELSVAGWMYSQNNTYNSQLLNAYHKILNEERRTNYAKIVPTDNESSTGSFGFFHDYRL